MNKFHGTGVAMVTPFNTDGSVDLEGLKRLINFQLDGGVQYLVSLGTTGEASTLSKEEKKSVWEFTKETVAGRVPLVAGIGGNSTSEVIQALEDFDSAGYDAILSVSPYYNRPTQEGIYQHYKAIAEATPLPVILYNVPARTGSNMTAETTLRLAHDFKNFIGVKEAAGNFDQFNKILRDKPEDFLFISGDDGVSLPLISMGAVGIISVVANAIPAIFSKMIGLCLEGKFKEAQVLHYKILEFTNSLFLEGNPGGVKDALKHLGICGDTLRLPLVNVGQSLSATIKQELEKLK
ncbi:4-hydroxy-tetrahydrodipicolinate synthase [Pedobacter sp. P351]|uniref:4-hydroxy-tetrahydrodipicolinate synthase n=1 Tax=Pedobacter superstes TaxID=3133441 RepID=UPI0030A117CF